MVKSIISAIIGFLILIGASIVENMVIEKSFNSFNDKLILLQQKIKDESATTADAEDVQSYWIEQKQILHILIPHNEIKEIDLWLAESVGLIETKTYDDALAKIEVAIELVEQIPKTFAFKIGNIM